MAGSRAWVLSEECLGHPVLGVWTGHTMSQGGHPPIPCSPPMILCPTGAVASSVVKQKLAEVILKKQQAALERTVHPNSSSIPYR